MPADGASGAAAGLAAAAKYGWLAKFVGLIGAGAVGAILIAAVDPAEAMPDPKKRRKLIFWQVVSAGVVSLIFTKIIVRWLDAHLDFIDLSSGDIDEWAEVALPVALLLGAMSWGVLGAMVKLRTLIQNRGARALAARLGLPAETAPGDLK